MADEKKQQNGAEQSSESGDQNTKTKSRGIMKLIIFGAAGLVLIALVMVGTLFLLGTGEDATSASPETNTDTHGSIQGHVDGTGEDSLAALLDQDAGVLEDLMSDLEFLDYQPDPSELGEEADGMSAEDSANAANWLEAEKARLVEKEKELSTREKELNNLDKKLSQKLLKLEQAESTRISNLARLYDGMEAMAVAKLMANLDDETVVAILPRMKQKNASQVLSLLPAKRAARLSKQMITIAEK